MADPFTHLLRLLKRKVNQLERFSIVCRKTKTKVMIMANQNKGRFQKEPMRTQSKYS